MSAPDPRPPRLGRWLLNTVLPVDEREAVDGDLAEEYARYARPQRGRLGADLWYWRQVLFSLPRWIARRARWDHFDRTEWVQARRALTRSPANTAAVIVTLALAIGVNVSVFTLLHSVLLRPLPYVHAERIVRPAPGELFFSDLAEAIEVQRRSRAFDEYAAWGRTLFTLGGDGPAEEVRGARVSWNHFEMLGAEAALGRTFVREDALTDDAILLSHALWMRRYGGDPSIVGEPLQLSGRTMTVVGVMPEDYLAMEFDWLAWRPLPLDPTQLAGSGMAGNGRLREGITLEAAEADFRRVMAEIWAEDGYVASPEELASLRVVPLREWRLGDSGPAMWVLFGAVGFLLLLACVNVANLLLAQNARRAQEFAVRAALGGSRTRIGRQRLIEVGMLFVLGGGAAVLLSRATLPWLAGLLPPDLPRGDRVDIDGVVLLFTLAATLAAAAFTAVVPILAIDRGGLGALSGSGRGVTAVGRRVRVRTLLVSAQMAMAVLLVVGAGLMTRTLISLRSADVGFAIDGVVTVRPSPPADRYPESTDLDGYYEDLTAELQRLPGVESVGAIQFLPMTPGGWWTSYRPEESVLDADQSAPSTAMRVVRGDYFRTMEIPLLAGRTLDATDDGLDGAAPGILVNQALARTAFNGEDPVGRILLVGGGETPHRVVGVVGDVRQSDVRTEPHPEAYVSFGARTWRRMHLVVRGAADDDDLPAAVAAVARGIDSEVALLGPRPLRDVVGQTFGDTRLLTFMLGLFGVVGLGLGAIGVYGVTAQVVAEQRKEIGIRLALGADSGGVVRRTIGRGLRPVAAGVAVGLGAAMGGAGLLEGLLFGIDPLDLGTFAAAPLVLTAVALAALTGPALRASRVDPVKTLREE